MAFFESEKQAASEMGYSLIRNSHHCVRQSVLLVGGHRAVTLENLALRQQVAIYVRHFCLDSR